MSDDNTTVDLQPSNQGKNEPSRRQFLFGAAALATGAMATANAVAADAGTGSTGSEGGMSCRPGGIIIGPDGTVRCCFKASDQERKLFAGVMIAAALHEDYRDLLLTFTEGQSTNWNDYTSSKRTAMLADTRKALKDKIDPLDPNYIKEKTPYVVLSNSQFESKAYVMKEEEEVVLRLPDVLVAAAALMIAGRPPKEVEKNQALLSSAMLAIHSHICGM